MVLHTRAAAPVAQYVPVVIGQAEPSCTEQAELCVLRKLHGEGGCASLCASAAAGASYCEIYNEALYDLLHWTKEQLQVRWDAGRGFHVPNLAVRDCPSVDDMLNVSAPACFLSSTQGPTRENSSVKQGTFFLHVFSS